MVNRLGFVYYFTVLGFFWVFSCIFKGCFCCGRSIFRATIRFERYIHHACFFVHFLRPFPVGDLCHSLTRTRVCIYIYFYCGRYKRNHMKSALNRHDMIIKPPNQTSIQPPFGGFQSMGVPPTTHRNLDRIFHEINHPAILKGYPPLLWKPPWNLDDFMAAHGGGKIFHSQSPGPDFSRPWTQRSPPPCSCPLSKWWAGFWAWNSNLLWKKSYEILVETSHHGLWKLGGVLLQ